MKKQLRMSGMSRKQLILLFGIILISTLSVSAQKYFELHDSYHNRSAIASEVNNGVVYHEYANGRLNAQWKFELVADSFYTITDKKWGKVIGARSDYNDTYVYHYNVTNTDNVQWSLVDVDGRGVLFYIKNKKYDIFLMAPAVGNGQMYLWDTINVTLKKCGAWRLIEKQGQGDMPKDVKGKEVKATSELVYTTNNNTTVSMYNLPGTLCGDVLGNQLIQGLPGSPPNDLTFMNSIPREKYGAMDQSQENTQSEKDYLISIYVNSPHRIDHTNNYVDLIDPTNNNWAGEKTRDSLKLVRRGDAYYNGNNKAFYLGEYKLNTVSKDAHIPLGTAPLSFGTASMLCRFFIQEQNLGNGTPISNTYLQIPFQVAGIVDHEVPILGYTTEPKIPYLVLHDPPGDLSTSSFSQSKTICRDFENTYSTDQSHEVHAKFKLGIAGSVGLIASANFEFSVEFGVGLTAGDLAVKTNNQGTCVSLTEGFMTSDLDPNIEEGSDIFIGYGYDMNYGKYRVVDFIPDSCKAVTRERLVYAIKGSGQNAYRQFVLTEGGIRNDIAFQKSLMDDVNLDQRTRANALYQYNAWNQVLIANDSIIANAAEPIGQPLVFSGGVQKDWSDAISVTQSSSLNTEHYLAATAGLETVLEFAGNGLSFGYNFNTEKRYGATQTVAGDTSTVLSYVLKDDDNGDFFIVDVLRDGRFGTPLFRVADGTKSSCPYEGGYQRDQPNLKINGQTENSIELHNVPIGDVGLFKVDLCNESNEDRTYIVSLGGGNPGGATVRLGGNNIGESPYTTPSVPAGGCLEDYVLTVAMNPGVFEYPNLEIVLSPSCDGAVSSSIFASVYFGTTAVIDETSPVKQLNVYPNPTSGEVNVAFMMEQPADIHFELFDMVGNRSLLTAEENYSAGEQHRTFNVDGLPSGIYQLAIKTNQSVISRKVIVQH